MYDPYLFSIIVMIKNKDVLYRFEIVL